MKTIAFDFDGVIHIGYKGWKDGSIYGGIDTELVDFIKLLMRDYYIVIFSNRPAQQIIDHMNSLDLGVKFEVFEKDMKDNMYWTKNNVIGVTNQKPIAELYVDDRGFRYHSLYELADFIDEMGRGENNE